MNPDRFFSPDPTTRSLARELYEPVATFPIVSPHGHVDPRLFSNPSATLGSPADLFIIPDHYVTRMLYSQGVTLEKLGVPRVDGGEVETDHRNIWHLLCANFHLFRGTPSGIWLTHELSEVFGIDEKPSAANADRLNQNSPHAPCSSVSISKYSAPPMLPPTHWSIIRLSALRVGRDASCRLSARMESSTWMHLTGEPISTNSALSAELMLWILFPTSGHWNNAGNFSSRWAPPPPTMPP
jgi:hypothetical protein